MAHRGKRGPCWAGYKIAGMKKKNGKKVPNCIKSASSSKLKSKNKRAAHVMGGSFKIEGFLF
jgi:hypothetical protein